MRIAVTGAFGFSGKYIAQRLLALQHEVITLTNSPQRPNPFGGSIKAFPYNFSEPHELEHVPPQLNQGDSRGAEDGRVYRH